MSMKNPPHPGLSVKHDCLEPLDLTVTAGAKVLGVSRKALSDLVNGHAGISPEMAVRLAKAFGGSPETWARLQLDYDIAQIMRRADTILVMRVQGPDKTARSYPRATANDPVYVEEAYAPTS